MKPSKLIQRRLQKNVNGRQPLPVPARIVLGLCLLVIIGTVLLMLPSMSTRQGSLLLSEALFTAVSALTVTGLSTISASTDLTRLGQIVLLALIQVGGVGYMFVASVVLRLIGRRIGLRDRLALSSSLGLSSPEAINKLLKRLVIGILAVETIGAMLLYVHWKINHIAPDGDTFFYALFHAISAFCNAGFDLFNGLGAYTEIPADNISLLILGGLILVGALGIPVFSDLLTDETWRRRGLSLHSRITFTLVLVLVFIGWVGMFIPEALLAESSLEGMPLDQQLMRTWFQSVSTRTAGFNVLPNLEQTSRATHLLIKGLMFIGSAPASMGGGITTGTFAVLMLSLWGYAKGWPSAQVGQRRIAKETTRRAGAVFTVGVVVVFFATWLMLLTHPHMLLEEALFEVISAFATCGLSLNLTGELNLVGQAIIILMMFWGRLGALTIVVAIAKQSKANQLVTYPEENILIG